MTFHVQDEKNNGGKIEETSQVVTIADDGSNGTSTENIDCYVRVEDPDSNFD